MGSGATRFVPGDRVFGEFTSKNQWSNAGTFAEFAAVDEALLARIPENLLFEGAAAVPTAALIALMNLCDQGRVKAGQRVLVNGVGGAVGVWAVQLANALGAEVTAVDASGKLDLLRDLGADLVIDGADVPARAGCRRNRLPRAGRREGPEVVPQFHVPRETSETLPCWYADRTAGRGAC